MSLHIRTVSSHPLITALTEKRSNADEGLGPTLSLLFVPSKVVVLLLSIHSLMFLPLDCGSSLFRPCLVINISGVPSSFAIILTRKREHDALCYCLPTISVLWLVLVVPWIGLKCVFVVLPNHTHSLFMGHFIKILYLSHNRAEKNQTRLYNCTVSPEHLEIALKR